MSNDLVQPLKPNRLSLAAQAQQYLFGLIQDGKYQPGEQLPSEKALAAKLGISRPTLREALLNLEQEGIVVRRHGVGTFVAPGAQHRLDSGLECLESILDLAARQQLPVQIDALEIQQEPANAELASKLRILPGTVLTSVRRVIVFNGTPVAYMADSVPLSILAPDQIDHRFSGSVLDLLRQQPDLHVSQAIANIKAVNADRFLSRKLEVKPGQALLLLEEIVFDHDGTAVEFSHNYFVPDFFQFHVVRR